MKYSRTVDEKTKLLLIEFILNCPSSIKKNKNYYPVSARNCSFKERGIKDALLRTLLAQIKKELPNRKCYVKVKPGESIENAIQQMNKESNLTDGEHEYIVLTEHHAMSETESVYYYIRNAFAHGSFNVGLSKDNDHMYSLESKKENVLKSQMLLKEATLETYITLMKKTPDKIKEHQRKKKSLVHQ